MIVLKEETGDPTLPSGTYNAELYSKGGKLYYAETNGNRVCISDPLPSSASSYTKVSKTSNYTVQQSEVQNNTIFDNNGATGTITFTLPVGSVGKDVLFFVSSGFNVIISGATLIGRNGTSYTSASSSTIGSICKLTCTSSGVYFVDTYTFTLA